MLKKLLRNFKQDPLTHEDANIRLQALEEQAIEENTLLQIMKSDTSAQVREKACSKINNKTQLLKVSADKNLRELALKRWAEILSDNSLTSQYDAEQIITECTEDDQLVAIISYCPNKSFIELALAGLKNEQQLLKMMANIKSNRFNLQAIEKIHDINNLKEAEKLVKGRDKTSLKRIKEKLQLLSKQAALAEEVFLEQHRLERKSEQLLKGSTAVHLQGEILNLQQQWERLLEKDQKASISNQAKVQFEQTINALEQCLKDQQQLQQQEIEIQAEKKEIISIQQQLNAVHDVCQKTLNTSELQINIEAIGDIRLNPLIEKKPLNKMLAEIDSLIAFQHQLHSHGALTLSSEKTSTMRYSELENKAEMLKLLLKKSETLSLDKNLISQLMSSHRLINQALSLHNTNNQATSAELKSLLSHCENLLDENRATEVQKKLTHIKKLNQQLSKQEAQGHQAAIQRIYKRLEDITDWQDYSTDPKRKNLIRDMNRLAETSLQSSLRLHQVKELQEQWKSLGYCHNKDLWQDFQTASDAAYAPCKEDFSAQKKLREFNARQKMEICEQLEGFIVRIDNNLDEQDWKSIRVLSRSIISEWKKFALVDQKKNKALQQRFSKSFEVLNERIHDQQEKTELQLKELCTRAQELAHIEDKQQAINTFQQLMQEWKTTNKNAISRHKQQQELWQKFKTAGDHLYEERQQQVKVSEHNSLENAKKADILISHIKHISSSIAQHETQNISEEKKEVKAALADFEALGPFPKPRIKAINLALEQAKEEYQSALKKAANNSWLKELQSLVEFGKQCSTEEQTNSASASLIPDHFCHKWKVELKQRFNNKDSIEELQKKARVLCIEIETLNGMQTAAEDTSLKMEVQMQKLSHNFGTHLAKNHKDSIEDLYLAWFSLPNMGKEHAMLEARFLKAAKA